MHILVQLQEADIWLFRSDFVFDFPRPTMPNLIYIGGFQCSPTQPLPADMEEFVQSAGEHGVIIMSLGTFIEALPTEVADDIADVFAKMPQKVKCALVSLEVTPQLSNWLIHVIICQDYRLVISNAILIYEHSSLSESCSFIVNSIFTIL